SVQSGGGYQKEARRHGGEQTDSHPNLSRHILNDLSMSSHENVPNGPNDSESRRELEIDRHRLAFPDRQLSRVAAQLFLELRRELATLLECLDCCCQVAPRPYVAHLESPFGIRPRSSNEASCHARLLLIGGLQHNDILGYRFAAGIAHVSIDMAQL